MMLFFFRYWKIILISGILVLTLIFCSNEQINNPSDDTPVANYFPSNIGNNYSYEVVQVDSSGGTQNGTRFSQYTGDTTINNIDYTTQLEDLSLDTSALKQSSFFRKTSTGVFYFADTTGFSEIVPDSLVDFLSTPSESRALLFPLAEGSFWPVFRVTVTNQQVSFSPLAVNGEFVREENITLHLVGGDIDVDAIKVKYTFTRQENPQQLPQQLNAYAWFAEDIGIVKLEGKAVLINLLVGGVDFSDTTSTITQSLIDYEIY